jgi:hypothetical protein
MLFGETIRQEQIVDRSCEGNVNDSTRMHMPDLSVSKAEFSSTEAMGVYRDSRPSRNYVFKRVCVLHYVFSDCSYFDV